MSGSKTKDMIEVKQKKKKKKDEGQRRLRKLVEHSTRDHTIKGSNPA
jgi:hypothetical protein